jgi:ribosomal protein S18 acetylase RimI-like enzyme
MNDDSSDRFTMRRFTSGDRDDVHAIRQRAFHGVFASFRALVGEEIARVEFVDADERQADYLDTICASGSGKEVYVLLAGGRVIGFLGLVADPGRRTGEIDLNAVDPEHQGRRAGQFMYAFALRRLRDLGASVVQVSTGADASHAPARHAYMRAGFSASIPSITYYRLV